MPLPAPYQGSSCEPSPFLLSRAKRLVPMVTVLGLSFGLAACEREYPLEPTFCDRWCQTFSECEFPPADCVLHCEDTRGPDACEDVRETLLTCYQEAPKDKFQCEITYQTLIRVEDGVCQTERDALYECAVPGIGQCLDACRVAVTVLDPALIASCPLEFNSCEEVCWILAQSGAGQTGSGQSGSGQFGSEQSSPSLADAAPVSSGDSLVLQLVGLCAIAGDAGAFPPIPM